MGYLSKEYENNNWKRYMNPMFIVALLTIDKLWKKPSIHQQRNG